MEACLELAVFILFALLSSPIFPLSSLSCLLADVIRGLVSKTERLPLSICEISSEEKAEVA